MHFSPSSHPSYFRLSPSEVAPLLSCDVIVAFSEAALSGQVHSFSKTGLVRYGVVAEAEQCCVGWMGNSFGVECVYYVTVGRNSEMNRDSILSGSWGRGLTLSHASQRSHSILLFIFSCNSFDGSFVSLEGRKQFVMFNLFVYLHAFFPFALPLTC